MGKMGSDPSRDNDGVGSDDSRFHRGSDPISPTSVFSVSLWFKTLLTFFSVIPYKGGQPESEATGRGSLTSHVSCPADLKFQISPGPFWL